EGGNAKVTGSQTANGGYVKDNEQTQNVGHSTGAATNLDIVTFDSTMNTTAWSGDANQSGAANAALPVSNSQSSQNNADIDLTQRAKVNQELTQNNNPAPSPY
ncbi:MAG TPA: hypothetical protein VHE14_00785, partial [Solirubrobacteraceae bacterium]|nr:hypothetical protein [Solirubrobacteraceae bacterium]